MLLTSQIISPEQAKVLKALGVKQLSLCHFELVHNSDYQELLCNGKVREMKSGKEFYYVSAYTVAELARMCIVFLKTDDYPGPSESIKDKYQDEDEMLHAMFTPELLADMLIDALRNEMFNIGDINRSLLED